MERFYMDLNDWILEVIQTSLNPMCLGILVWYSVSHLAGILW